MAMFVFPQLKCLWQLNNPVIICCTFSEVLTLRVHEDGVSQTRQPFCAVRPQSLPVECVNMVALATSVSVTRLSCSVDSLGPFVLLTCYHGGRFCRTDIVEDHKRLITVNNYISQDWNDFNLAVRSSSLRFSFGRDWNDKFQLRCSNDKFQLRCSNSTESDQARMGQDPRLGPYRVAMIKTVANGLCHQGKQSFA